MCKDKKWTVYSGPAVIVGDGAKSMCKDKTWTCVFLRSQTSQQTMCKDKQWTVGFVDSGPAAIVGDGAKPRRKDKSGRVFPSVADKSTIHV